MQRTRPELTQSLEDFANLGNDVVDMSYAKSSVHQSLKSITYPLENLIIQYYELLTPHLATFSLNANEYFRYKYKPDLLAYDLYGSIDLGFLILMFNNCISDKEFSIESKTLKLLKPQDLYIINQILNCEKELLQADE